jgi:hypothetical protein
VGNEEIGFDLIKRIIHYKKIQNNINVAFCFNSDTLMKNKKIKSMISNNFDFYAIYKCKELGSDIVPTILMYNEIVKKHKFKHIFKMHTKSIKENYLKLTNFIISRPLDELIKQNTHLLKKGNCIGYPDYCVNLMEDVFNNELKKRFLAKIDSNKCFIAGTIFYASSDVFDSILYFIKNNNYRSYLLNNLYENNSINRDFSPNHFLERLFGVIKC